MFFGDDWRILGDVFEEREGAEEGVRGDDLSDALLRLFALGGSQEEDGQHFVDLDVVLLAHIFVMILL